MPYTHDIIGFNKAKTFACKGFLCFSLYYQSLSKIGTIISAEVPLLRWHFGIFCVAV